ncbi:MAG: hypothetical protein IH953_09610 [Chloroflexi bacterium]|nr:hypothetical protein [Chloroflexota bacterium]
MGRLKPSSRTVPHPESHKAWFIADLDSKEQAMSILPPLFRENAKVIELQQFTPENADHTIAQHGD